MPETLTDVDKISTKEGNKTRKPVADGIEAREKKLQLPNTKIEKKRYQKKLK